jgi:hypothetical protein
LPFSDRAKFEESGVDSVLTLMRIYSKDAMVQAEICRLVMDLAATGSRSPNTTKVL